MLEYDNSAFYYFGISLLTVYVIPATYFSVKRILFGCFFTDHLIEKENVRSEKELQKMRTLHAEKTKLSNVFSVPFIANLIVLSISYYMLYTFAMLVKDDSQIKTFDPFEILEIASGATDREIKRAYRKLSLIYHPDKNPGDNIAESKFMLVAKAYESLTDEIAKANYEKYGNPDGRQALQLSIGLPTFLLNSENYNVIILIYLLVFVVVVPSVVALYYSRSKKFGDNMILYDTYGFYNFALSEHTNLKSLPEILAGSAEFREIPMKESDNEALHTLARRYKQDNLMPKPRFNHPSIVKANILIHAHLFRDELPPSLRKDLNQILEIALHLVDGMLEICTMKSWLQTTINVLEFQQLLTQALWIKDSPLLQLPHFTEGEVKHCITGKNATRNIQEFIDQSPELRKGMNKFTEEQKEEVNSVCKILPHIDYEVIIGVDDEDCIAEGDIMSVRCKVTRNNVPEGETCDLVYAPEYPYPKAERWVMLLGDVKGSSLHAIKKITSTERIVEEKIMIQAPPKAGTYALEFYLKSDSYMGLDKRQTVKFTVVSADSLPEFTPHPEDVELDNEPSLFDQMMTAGMDDSSDSEDEDEEDNEEDNELSESQQKKRVERLRRRKQDSSENDADEDEDNETEVEDKKNA